MEKAHGFLELFVSWPKPYAYGYWSGHPCLVGVAGPNVAGVSIIKAEKHTCINETILYAR